MPTMDELYDAIADNNLVSVKRLLECEDGLSYTNSYAYSSPLLQAAGRGCIEIVSYLLDRNYYCIDDGNDTTCYSPLMIASENGHVEIVRMLLKNGADVHRMYEKEGNSDESFGTGQEQGYPLTLAVENCHAEIVQLLLMHKADPDCIKYSYDGSDNFEETPLLLAIYNNDAAMAELLLKHGADVNGECLVNGEPHTPLSYAVAKKKEVWIQFLQKRGANIEKEVKDCVVSAKDTEGLNPSGFASRNPENGHQVNGDAIVVNSESDVVVLLEAILSGKYDYLGFGIGDLLDSAAECLEQHKLMDVYDNRNSLLHQATDYLTNLIDQKIKSDVTAFIG